MPYNGEKMKYRVEFFDIKDNCWIVSSRHNNQDFAVLNADVILQRKGVSECRVIHNGNIVYNKVKKG